MTQATDTLTSLFWAYRAAWVAAQQTPDDDTILAAMHRAAHVFASAAYPVMQRMSNTIMKGKAGGRDIAEPKDLASVVFSKHFLEHPIFPKLESNETSPSEGHSGLESYLYTVLNNEFLDDWRRLHGRKKTKTTEPTEPDDPTSTGAGNNPAEKPKQERVPRIYVNMDDPGIANEVTGIASDRRTQSGYYALQQTRHFLEIYLRQIPGRIVQVSVKATDPSRGMKRVTLTQGHAVMLRLWMAGDGEHGWQAIAQELGRPEGTVKRWFSEVAKHFKTDTTADAVALRSLYDVKDSAVPEYDEEPDEAAPGENATIAPAT